MKLTELNPRWCAVAGRRGQGITFDCPHCRRARLVVFFANPIDGGEPLPHERRRGSGALEVLTAEHDAAPKGFDIVPPGFHWRRSGDAFETLSLTPSVDASAAGHWHGFVTGGQTA